MIKKFEEGKQHVFLNQGKMYAAYLNGQYYLGKDVDKTEDIGESATIKESGTYLLTPGRYAIEISGGAGGKGGIELTSPPGTGLPGKNGELFQTRLDVMTDDVVTILIGAKGEDGPSFTWSSHSDDYTRVGRPGEPTFLKTSQGTYEAKGGSGGKMKSYAGGIWGKPESSGAKNNNGSNNAGYVEIHRIG